MKKECKKRFFDSTKGINRNFETYEGEFIENKISRMTENGEPITDGMPLVYTKRSDGVLPEYNIRTDKWELAQEKMNYVSETKRNKIKESMKKGLPTKTETTETTETTEQKN